MVCLLGKCLNCDLFLVGQKIRGIGEPCKNKQNDYYTELSRIIQENLKAFPELIQDLPLMPPKSFSHNWSGKKIDL